MCPPQVDRHQRGLRACRLVTDERAERIKQLRREPPPLQPVTVTDRQELSPRMWRFKFDGLQELAVEGPAASVRLLVPSPGADELVIPEWNGNEFLMPDGSRPALRTFTPLRVNEEAGRVDLEIVRHGDGVISSWAEQPTWCDRCHLRSRCRLRRRSDRQAVRAPGRRNRPSRHW